ncbi:hypothetical protein [Streptomyces hainanensis]|uniref:DUF402 domain-containing protein n=1 Tax=Streptomyces hainanensis TaxID=402648 RepID=A0A4R4TMF8_9ACTN|nr:hypothetical protein [Streptomyces hainanensis]TDC79020.1 hypothetical protein E1283_03655 [Streptomyces hainanensis]
MGRGGAVGAAGSGTERAALVAFRDHGFTPVAARLIDNLLYSDQIYHRHDGPRRYFWLIEEDVQLVYEPFGWRNEWYVDVVSFVSEDRGGLPLFTVHDRYLDLVVEGMGPTYRAVDLDEAGEALVSGSLNAHELRLALTATQRFTDAYLHRGAVFPPPAVARAFSADHDYPNWCEAAASPPS